MSILAPRCALVLVPSFWTCIRMSWKKKSERGVWNQQDVPKRNGKWERIFALRRTSGIKELYIFSLEVTANSLNVRPSNDTLWRFWHDYVLQEFHFLFGFAPASTDSAVIYPVIVEGAIVVLVRLDAFDATAIFCLRLDRSDKHGGHWKKLYPDPLAAYLLFTYNNLVQLNGAFVELSFSDELCDFLCQLNKTEFVMLPRTKAKLHLKCSYRLQIRFW